MSETTAAGRAEGSEVELHFVAPETVQLLDRVDDDVFDHPVQREYLDSFLANPAHLLVVAVAEGEVIGMATAMRYAHPDKPPQLFIVEVGVSSRFGRRGIASRLCRALLDRGRALGCVEAWVATEVENHPARALYESLGGREDEDHAVVYTYPLTP